MLAPDKHIAEIEAVVPTEVRASVMIDRRIREVSSRLDVLVCAWLPWLVNGYDRSGRPVVDD
jgi:hypothetical protein